MIESTHTTLPKVSIVTVCYNCVEQIEKTILSVIKQKYSNFEYLVIDGCSKDGTVDIIKKYKGSISFWESTIDSGIYDAMNKGIQRANGDWILFMNAGDCFYDDNVLQNVFSRSVPENKIVVYGNAIYEMDFGRFYAKPIPLSNMSCQSVIFHQSCFIKLTYHKSHLFDLKYRLGGDYNFFYQLYNDNKDAFYYVDEVMSIYEAVSGISTTNQTLSYIERNMIQGHPVSSLRARLFDCKFQVSRFVNKLLPHTLYVLRCKRKLDSKYFTEIKE